MTQAFWKTYKSKVLQTLSGESEEDLAEEVGTIHACWVGHGRGAAGVRGTRKGKGQVLGGAHICVEATGTFRGNKWDGAESQGI